MHDFLETLPYIPFFPFPSIRDCADRYEQALYKKYERDTRFFAGVAVRYIRFWWEETYNCAELGEVFTKNYVTFYFVPTSYKPILLHPDYDYYLHDLAVHCERIVTSYNTRIMPHPDLARADMLEFGRMGYAVIDSSIEQFQLFGGDTSLSILLDAVYLPQAFYQF